MVFWGNCETGRHKTDELSGDELRRSAVFLKTAARGEYEKSGHRHRVYFVRAIQTRRPE